MACVVAELTGVPGVVLTAISPGVANVANGVAYAYLERVPLLVLSDSYPWGASQVVLRQTLNHRQLSKPLLNGRHRSRRSGHTRCCNGLYAPR